MDNEEDTRRVWDSSAHSVLMKQICVLKEGEELCDLTFVLSGGARFPAHRLILSAWSPVMRQLLGPQDGPDARIAFADEIPHLADAR